MARQTVQFGRLVPPILWMALIFAMSSVPDLQSDLGTVWDTVVRKIAHVAEYAILAALIFRAVQGSHQRDAAQVLLTLFITILYAATDEWHQTVVAGRQGSWQDVGIDALGAALGTALYAKPPALVSRWVNRLEKR